MKAFSEFSKMYHTEQKKEYTSFIKDLLKCASTDKNVAVTRGYTRCLTSLSPVLMKQFLHEILKVCEENCKIKDKMQDDADTRKFSV